LNGFLKKATELAGVFAPWQWYQRNGFYRIAALLGGGNESTTGEIITPEKAMRCAPVYICTRAITETIASLPLPVLKKVGENTEILRSEPLWAVFNRSANGYQSARVFRRLLTHYALNYGNGMARIQRRGEGPDAAAIAMHPIHPRDLVKKDVVMGEAVYVVREGGQERTLQNHEVFHLMNHSDDGMLGVGALDLGRDTIAQAIAIETFGSTFFARGGLKAGLIKKVMPFKTAEDRNRFETDFQARYRSGKESFHKNLLVEGDWDYKPIGADPTESQLTEASASMVAKIARFYGITPHLAGDLSNAHYNNVEHLWIEFLNITLAPWMTAWEQEIQRVLLTPKQRDSGIYAKHNTAAFARGDFEARMRAYSTLLQNGIASINEVRSLEDWDPMTGGDALHIQLNMQTVPGTGEPTASEARAAQQTQQTQQTQREN
jgi:HK97 family phage portal protein